MIRERIRQFWQLGRKSESRQKMLAKKIELANIELDEVLRKRACFDSLAHRMRTYAEVEEKASLLAKLHLVYTQMSYRKPLAALTPIQTQIENYDLLKAMDLDSPSSLDAYRNLNLPPCKDLQELESNLELIKRTLKDMQPNLPSQEEFVELTIQARSFKYSAATLAVLDRFCSDCANDKEILQRMDAIIQDIQQKLYYAIESHGRNHFEQVDGFSSCCKMLEHETPQLFSCEG